MTYEAGVSKGTADNRRRQSELLLKFCVVYNVQCLNPSIIDVLMFIQFLKNSFASHVSVKNYVSGARTWVAHHKGCCNSFDTPEVKQMFAAVDAVSDHVVTPAYPLSASDIKIVCDYIETQSGIPLCVKPCILIGYTCFLRACNLLSPSTQIWTGKHTLLTSDVIPNQDGLLILLRSSKTFTSKNSRVVHVRPVQVKKYCPVFAWHQYKSQVNPCPIGLAFMVNDYTPLISRNVVDVLNAALRPVLPSEAKVSMHSLRRGGTQTATRAGASNKDLMLHGTRRSSKGLKYYLPNPKNDVPNIIADTLASTR